MVTTPLFRQQGTEALKICLEVAAVNADLMPLPAEASLGDVGACQDVWPLPCEETTGGKDAASSWPDQAR